MPAVSIRSAKLQQSGKGWPPRRRAQQAANARRTRPWTRSTGPRTAEGKARSSLNALKNGAYARAAKAAKGFLWQQKRFLSALNIALRLHAKQLTPFMESPNFLDGESPLTHDAPFRTERGDRCRVKRVKNPQETRFSLVIA
jgi:hypothetical protein